MRTTNLLERLFGEERRRTKVIPHAFGERETRFATGRAFPFVPIQPCPKRWKRSREIAGSGANAEIQELARRLAEAQIDLRRVRYARHKLLVGCVERSLL